MFGAFLLVFVAFLAGCSGASSSNAYTPGSTTRTLTSYVTVSNTAITTYAFNTTKRVCYQISMYTNPCATARQDLGLNGNWLDFSCNVVEGLATSSYASTTNILNATYVSLQTDDLPNYDSNYYPTSGSYNFTANGFTVTGLFDTLYQSYTTAFPDPNSISAQNVTMYVPLNPTEASPPKSQTMGMGAVGMALNGVMIFDDVAAGTDNIFAEDGSFDQCGGHPQSNGEYHYHGEPFALSYNDDRLIGVMRDGFFIYGRNDNSNYTSDYASSTYIIEPGSIANGYRDNGLSSQGGDTLTGTSSDMYIYGGHVGVPPTGGQSIFHYHLTEWKACYDESGGTKSADDGETYDSYNTPTGTCSGQWVDAWLLTGHGNGGVFQTLPSGLTGQTPSQSTTAIRYYYGTPANCTGC